MTISAGTLIKAVTPSGTSVVVLARADGALIAAGGGAATVDSTGAALPNDFDSLPLTMTYSAGVLQTAIRTKAPNTWTQTYTYTGSNLTAVSAWVKA